MPHRFSPSEKAFYSVALEARYRAEKLWPNDLVDVTDAQYREYALHSPPIGKMLSADADGMPTWADAPATEPEPASISRARSIVHIDTRAGQVRAAYASDGTLVDAEYQQALDAARDWDTAGRPENEVPDEVKSWADATGNSADWAATDILNTADIWKQAITRIRHVRLTGKQAIRSAADGADFDAIAQTYLDQLDQIAANVPEEVTE